MKSIALLPVIVLLFLSSLLAACDTPGPSSGSIKVNVLQLQAHDVSLDELASAFSAGDLVPPFYEQPAGTHLYAVVIPFDIMTLPDGVSFNSLNVVMNVLKEDGTGAFSLNEDIRVVARIPSSVDRTADKESSLKVAAGISAALSILTGNVTVEQSNSESYQRFYRTVSSHLTPDNAVVWEFVPFQDEPLLPGTYYVVAVIEVPDGTTGNLVYVLAGCSFAVSQMFGLFEESDLCTAGTNQRLELPES